MANNPICPLLIIKDKLSLRSKKANGKLRFAVCTDGSEKSLQTIRFLTRFLVLGRGDEIVAICVEHANVDAAAAKQTFKQTIAEYQVILMKYNTCQIPEGLTRFVTLRIENVMDTVDKTIVDFLMASASDDNYIDFVAVGNNGADFSNHSDAKYLGSVARGVITKCNLNVIFFAC